MLAQDQDGVLLLPLLYNLYMESRYPGGHNVTKFVFCLCFGQPVASG